MQVAVVLARNNLAEVVHPGLVVGKCAAHGLAEFFRAEVGHHVVKNAGVERANFGAPIAERLGVALAQEVERFDDALVFGMCSHSPRGCIAIAPLSIRALGGEVRHDDDRLPHLGIDGHAVAVALWRKFRQIPLARIDAQPAVP